MFVVLWLWWVSAQPPQQAGHHQCSCTNDGPGVLSCVIATAANPGVVAGSGQQQMRLRHHPASRLKIL